VFVKYMWRHAVISIRFLTGSTHGVNKKLRHMFFLKNKSSIVISVDLHNVTENLRDSANLVSPFFEINEVMLPNIKSFRSSVFSNMSASFSFLTSPRALGECV
jgi:adenine C2-methylase RlmN of 23S rRNA A2503 and tRNA A37